MKYYVIAGEASGDLHGSNLVKQIKQLDTQAEFRAWGGDLLQQQGATVVKHYRDLAFMGFIEVAKNIGTIMGNFKACETDILQYKPDAIILIDYPGFNLRIAKWAKKLGFKVIYYISPQVWAWKQSRVHDIKKYVDLMLVILPFEEEFYKKFGYMVHFVGHPLLDAIEQRTVNSEQLTEEEIKKRAHDNQLATGNRQPATYNPYIALLPGSRKQEIETILPIMLKITPYFPQFNFVVAGAPSIPESFYKNIIRLPEIKLVSGDTYGVISRAYAALVTSGTATLETALFNTPQVVCYKGNKLSYLIARRLIKVKYISLVNLILDRPVVTELIQDDLEVERIQRELDYLILDTDNRRRMLNDYKELKEKLGGPGASARAAGIIIDYLKKNE